MHSTLRRHCPAAGVGCSHLIMSIFFASFAFRIRPIFRRSKRSKCIGCGCPSAGCNYCGLAGPGRRRGTVARFGDGRNKRRHLLYGVAES